MGTKQYGAHLHVDDVRYATWQAQISGRKRWTLRPPPECSFSCPLQDLEVILEPGEISKQLEILDCFKVVVQ